MTVETKDLTKAEIEFLSDKYEALEKEVLVLLKQLDIAESALRKYANPDNWSSDFTADDCLYVDDFAYREAEEALKQIKELDK